MNENLKKYNQKRDFKKTKEPKGKLEKKKTGLSFVIQHHISRRDHFDLRLEWEGTLKSWAIPKGPSYSPSDKRLAIRVEDHPFEYRNFEGVIPKGEYGGGTVMIWDEGDWKPLGEVDKKLNETIKFSLNGKRLKGKWALVKMKDNNWLLIKEHDVFIEEEKKLTRFKTSIRTGRTMKEINDEG